MQSKPKTDDEIRLIIYLLKTNAEETEFNSLVQSGIDWNRLFQKAEDHRVMPLLFKKLKTDNFDLIPKDIFDKFQNRYQEIAKFNFARTTQLIKLVGELQKHNLPVMAYKGMALAEFAYKDVTLRQFTDIDLLIRKKDFFKVKDLLMQIGGKPAWELTEKQERAVLKYYYEYPFFYGENNTIIEVHWEFLETFFAFDLKIEDVWNRCQTIKIYGKEIKTLSAEDCLLFLCTHGSKHFWVRLSWICDVAKLIENAVIDWDLVVKLGRKTGSLRMLRLGLYLAKELLKTELPNEINEQISRDSAAVNLGETFKNYLLNDEMPAFDWTAAAKLHLKMREKPLTKIKFAKRLLMTKAVDKLFLPMGRPQ